MNERIQELAEQAGFKVNWQHEDVQALKMARFEKFAELIVKECAGVCHTHGWGMLEHGMSGHNIADDCGTLIKEHFGVE